MTYVEPKVLLERIYDQEFGFRLTNFAIKPVHLANGLARSLTGRTYDTTALTETLRRYVRNQSLGVDEERNPNQAILQRYGEAFEPLRGPEPDPQKLTRLRALVFDVLAADDAVFPAQQSYTFSNERFITRDPSDVRTGRFLARLLTAEPTSRTDAAQYIRELLRTEGDAWTTLALPLLQLGQAREEPEDSEAASRAALAEQLFVASDGHLASPALRRLRDAYDRLARFERLSGSKLNSLRRLMLFGCFVVHVHAISRWAEREDGAPRPPILLDLFEGTAVSVRDASRASLQAAANAVEGLIRMRCREHVVAEYGETSEEIDQGLTSSPEAGHLRSMYENYREGGSDPVDAMTRVFIEDGFEKVREHPIGFLVELGRRAGFLSPWSNQGRGGKLQKRYTATAEFLETLIAATVEPAKPLEFPEFLGQLRTDYGIVVGRPEDDPVIRHNSLMGDQFGPLTAINEEGLRHNVVQMRELVIESGYAKAYADGVTMVTTRPEGPL